MLKDTLSLLFFIILFSSIEPACAQSKYRFNYQAVIRDARLNPIINKNISIRLSIIEGSVAGTFVYSEEMFINTGPIGIINISIGNKADFDLIDWSKGKYFLRIEVDTNGGKDFIEMGTTELLSVPFSLYSRKAETADYNNLQNTPTFSKVAYTGDFYDLNNKPEGVSFGDMLYWDETKWVRIPPGQNGQQLTFCNGIPIWGVCPDTILIPIDELIEITEIENCFLSEDHTAEGILVTYPNGCIDHFFRLDPGLSGHHIGNNGQIVKRSSCDDGNSWTTPKIVFNSNWDDRNIRGGITNNGVVLIFFRQYDATKDSTINLNYILSSDYGLTWSSPFNIMGIGLCDFCTYSDYINHLKDNYYMLSQTLMGYSEIQFFTIDDTIIHWTGEKYIFDFRGLKNIDEPRFAHLGDGKIIGLFRDDLGSNYFQTTSSDYGKSWTIPVKTNLNNNLFSPNPEVFYDESTDILYVIGTDRGSPNISNAVWVYANRPNEVFGNPNGYRLIRKFERPHPTSFRLYGYPATTRLSNGDYLIIFTESYKKENGKEQADFYQFKIKYK